MEETLIERIKNRHTIDEFDIEQDLNRPWGGYQTFARNRECTSKILIVNDELSLQAHRQRDEVWQPVQGRAAVYRGEQLASIESTIANLQEIIISPWDRICIPRTLVHTAVNLGDSPALFIEIAFGYADEKDTKKFYDKHGRVKLEGYPSGLSIRELIPLCRERLGL